MGPLLARTVVGRPLAILLAALALALAASPAAMRLRLDTDLVDLVPTGTPGAAAFARFSRAFAPEHALILLVEGEDAAVLPGFVDRLAAALRAVPGVVDVRAKVGQGSASLLRDHLLQLLDGDEIDALAARTTPEALRARVQRLRGLLAAPGGSAMAPIITADPLGLLEALGARLRSGLPVDTGSGYFRSADGRAMLLFIRPTHGPFEIETSRAMIAAAGREVVRLGGRVGAEVGKPGSAPAVSFTGPYAYSVEYRDWLHRDMELSTLFAIIGVLLFFAVFLKAVRALPLVAVPLCLGLYLTGALAGALFTRVNAVSLAFGTILVAIGIDLPIQIYNRLREELSLEPEGGDRRLAARRAVERTFARLVGPSLVATLGPAAVFFACALSQYRGLAELGVLAGAGLLLNFAVMVTVLPALLAILPPGWWAPARRPRDEGAAFAWLGRRTAARPRAVLVVAGLLAVAATPLALRLRHDEKLLSVQPAGMRAGIVEREIARRMGGRQNLLVVLSSDGDGDRALARSDAWRAEAERLRRAGVLASYDSISNLYPSLEEQRARRARLARLDPGRIAGDLRRALDEAGFDVEPFAGFLAQLEREPSPLTVGEVPAELRFLVSAHLRDEPGGRLVATFLYPAEGRVEAAVDALRRFAADHPGIGEVTGTPILDEALQRVLRVDTRRVTAASVLVVALILILTYRRWRPVVAVLAPLSLAWLLFAATMGGLGLPLNLFNLLVVPLVVGYGIDDHVFLLHRHREAPERGVERALASTGRAIVVTSLSTIAGFAGLAVARFDGLRLLGLTGSLAVALCLLVALAVQPALLTLLWPRVSDSRRGGGSDSSPTPG